MIEERAARRRALGWAERLDARGPRDACRRTGPAAPATVIDGSISPPWAGTRLHPVTDVEESLDAGPFLNHQGVGGHDSRTEERR